MNGVKIFGLLSILSVTSFLILGGMVYADAPVIASVYFKTLLFSMCFMVTSLGLYAINKFVELSKGTKLGITIYGLSWLGFSYLIAFNILDYSKTWNILIASGIVLLMLIQVQVLAASKKNSVIARLFELSIIASNCFLIILFLLKWDFSALSLWINFAVLVSVLSFVLGMILTKRPKNTVEQG